METTCIRFTTIEKTVNGWAATGTIGARRWGAEESNGVTAGEWSFLWRRGTDPDVSTGEKLKIRKRLIDRIHDEIILIGERCVCSRCM